MEEKSKSTYGWFINSKSLLLLLLNRPSSLIRRHQVPLAKLQLKVEVIRNMVVKTKEKIMLS
jgi:hypothetical protein